MYFLYTSNTCPKGERAAEFLQARAIGCMTINLDDPGQESKLDYVWQLLRQWEEDPQAKLQLPVLTQLTIQPTGKSQAARQTSPSISAPSVAELNANGEASGVANGAASGAASGVANGAAKQAQKGAAEPGAKTEELITIGFDHQEWEKIFSPVSPQQEGKT